MSPYLFPNSFLALFKYRITIRLAIIFSNTANQAIIKMSKNPLSQICPLNIVTNCISNTEIILKRENARLEMSLKDGVKKYGEDKQIIVCMHYPPFNSYEKLDLNFIETMKKYNVTKCIYGHIHGIEAHKDAFNGKYKGIDMQLVSCDYTKFKLIKVED